MTVIPLTMNFSDEFSSNGLDLLFFSLSRCTEMVNWKLQLVGVISPVFAERFYSHLPTFRTASGVRTKSQLVAWVHKSQIETKKLISMRFSEAFTLSNS